MKYPFAKSVTFNVPSDPVMDVPGVEVVVALYVTELI